MTLIDYLPNKSRIHILLKLIQNTHQVFVSSPNSYVDALTPSVAVFGDGASEVVVKVTMKS